MDNESDWWIRWITTDDVYTHPRVCVGYLKTCRSNIEIAVCRRAGRTVGWRGNCFSLLRRITRVQTPVWGHKKKFFLWFPMFFFTNYLLRECVKKYFTSSFTYKIIKIIKIINFTSFSCFTGSNSHDFLPEAIKSSWFPSWNHQIFVISFLKPSNFHDFLPKTVKFSWFPS